MALTWWWLTPFVLVVVGALVVVGVWRSRRRDGTLVAHTDRLTALPGWRDAMRRHRLRLGAMGVVLVIALAAAAVLAGRPGVTRPVSAEHATRDIVLCLDVSGSMTSTASQVIQSFTDIVTDLRGERIGLVLFNNQAVTVLPLTSDYGLGTQTLDEYGAGLTAGPRGLDDFDPTRGTFASSIGGSSLIADGLASCVAAFDRPDEDRSRSLVLGTDNMAGGSGIYSMGEAVTLARALGARVYPINPMPLGSAQRGLAEVAERTGGRAYTLDDGTSVASVTAEIERTERRLTRSAPELLTADQPAPAGIVLGFALLGYLAVAWRWRR